jgi:hypothetical protein
MALDDEPKALLVLLILALGLYLAVWLSQPVASVRGQRACGEHRPERSRVDGGRWMSGPVGCLLQSLTADPVTSRSWAPSVRTSVHSLPALARPMPAFACPAALGFCAQGIRTRQMACSRPRLTLARRGPFWSSGTLAMRRKGSPGASRCGGLNRPSLVSIMTLAPSTLSSPPALAGATTRE